MLNDEAISEWLSYMLNGCCCCFEGVHFFTKIIIIFIFILKEFGGLLRLFEDTHLYEGISLKT